MITLKNPETGQSHDMDADAFTELRAAYTEALAMGRDQVVFRAMRLDVVNTEDILACQV